MGCGSQVRALACVLALASCRGSGVAPAASDTTGSTGNGDASTVAATSATTSGADTSTGEPADGTSSIGDETGCDPSGDPPRPDVSSCANGCEANPFDVEHISGLNYAARLVHVLSPACVGPTCPEPLTTGTYGTEAIGPCEETDDALASARGPATFCKLAPIALTYGLDVGFTQPPDRESITLERPRIDNPSLTEDYVWHAGIVEIRGPATEYNGDYVRGGVGPDLLANARNLACLENLEALGIAYDPDDLDAACAATFAGDDGQPVPLRMRADDVLRPGRGRLDSRTLSCSTPDEGVDTCCSACDHELSVAVAKYGVDDDGARRSPNAGSALACDPGGDRFSECREFQADVDRSREVQSFRYDWGGCVRQWPLPRYDKVRQTHPGDRPAGVEPVGITCAADDECDWGQECVGTDTQSGDACHDGASCADRRCQAEWFVACRSDPQEIAGPSYCVDTRHRGAGAGACLAATAPFDGVGGTQPAGARLAHCDTMTDGELTAAECCQESLGDEAVCDPLFQSGVVPIDRHDRDTALPATALCACTDPTGQPASCSAVVASSCAEPVGAGTDPGAASQPDEYAQRAVRQQGGVRYDAELEGFDLRLEHRGNLERSLPEQCAESAGLVGRRNHADGWLANESFTTTLGADHDRAMCSGSTYVVHFAGPGDPEHVVAEAGHDLAGKQRYVLETVEFVVTPGSGFPVDNLLVDACSAFSLRFSNKYDLSVDNQRKVSIWELEDQAGEWVPLQRIAGGRDCDPDATAGEVQLGAIPCLVVDIGDHALGEIEVFVDFERYGQLLQAGSRYRIVVPGLDDPAQIGDAPAYADAFHDACGMPLITGDLPEPEYLYDVTIDTDCM